MSQVKCDRSQWLKAPPRAGEAPWYAFRTVSTRWVNNNPNSRENTTRQCLERLFSKPFPKVRPAFLKDPASGQRWPLELDTYCAELKLAVEFHGIQVSWGMHGGAYGHAACNYTATDLLLFVSCFLNVTPAL
jgi:hypothetical protein